MTLEKVTCVDKSRRLDVNRSRRYLFVSDIIGL
jgi:hypothetical protein